MEDDCDTMTSLQGEGTHYNDVTKVNEEGLVHKILDNLTRVPVFPHDNFRMTNFGVEFQPSVPPKKIKVNHDTIFETDIPPNFLCPITRTIMKEAVICADGFSYEKQAIEKWFSEKDTSPMTNLRLEHKRILDNKTLQAVINDWIVLYRSK